jgi:squalene-hopene/tetraprenyl-beta-curcumene cyclase
LVIKEESPRNTSARPVGTPSLTEVDQAIGRSQSYFRRCQYTDGYWWGEVESNNTMEAEYLLLSYFLGRVDRERWRKAANYILSKQRQDGSWGQYYGSPGDVSTSVECYFALKLAGYSPDAESLRKAREFILSRGGVSQVRVFTKIWLSLFGQWDWKGTPNMPPELILLPPCFPFNIYEFSSWARPTIVPLLIVLTEHPVCQVPDWANIDELYPRPRSETDYSLPKPHSRWGWARLLYHLDRLVGRYQKLPIHPFRGLAERKVEQWVLSRQEVDGSWAGIQPPSVYSLIALHHLGYPPHHPVIEKGFFGFERFAVEDEDTLSLQGCISPVWDTCLVQLALLESGMAPDDPVIRRSARWLLDQQILTSGDWQVRARNAEPGGWAFEFHNSLYPDIDDAAVVIMSLQLADLGPKDEPRKAEAIRRGAAWLVALQSQGGGWAAFDKNNTRRYLNRLPFSDFGEVLDPPSADVTAHVLECLGKLGYSHHYAPLCWGYDFIRREQEKDGSWFGRWGVNYIYGIGAVLPALAAIGEDMGQPYIRQAVNWLVNHQNADGGWGESCGSYVDPNLHGVGPSTASQTAWALLGLLAAGEADHPATQRGVRYLINTQKEDGTWDEPYFTGTGFPGYGVGERLKKSPKPGERGYQGLEMGAGFMINYHMYRNCWPLLALGRYRKMTVQNNGLSWADNLGAAAPAISTEGRKKKRGNMKTKSFCLQLTTHKAPEFIDITNWVCQCVAQAKVINGFVVVYSKHTTAAIKINENEPLLIEDMTNFLERICPRHGEYHHNNFEIRTVNMNLDESPNGHAHLQHLMLGCSETIPLIDGMMQFGRYQSIFFIELDHPRPREVMVQIVGE